MWKRRSICYPPKASPCGYASNDAYAYTVNALNIIMHACAYAYDCSHTPFTHTSNRASRVKSRTARRDGLGSAHERPRASTHVCGPIRLSASRAARAPAQPISCPRLQAMSLPCPFPTACSDREHDAPMGLAQPCGVLAGAAVAGLKPSGKQCNSTAPDATAADRAYHLRWHCLRAHISRVGWKIAAAPPGHCLRAYPIRRLALSSPVVSDDTTG